jgi:putative DNA primase/helicase
MELKMIETENTEAARPGAAPSGEHSDEFQQKNTPSSSSRIEDFDKTNNTSDDKFRGAQERSKKLHEQHPHEEHCSDSNKASLELLTYEQLVNRAIPPRQFILSPWLPESGIAMVYSRPGVGKTYLGLSIALAVASGEQLFDWTVPIARKVLYLDGEMHESDLQVRIKKLGLGFKSKNFNNLLFINGSWLPKGILMPDLATPEGQRFIDERLGDTKLLVLDNLSTLIRTGKDNDAEAWRPVQSWLLTLRWRGISTLIVHHAGKSNNDDGIPIQRGSSAREIILETILALKRPKDYSAEDGCLFEGHFTKFRGSSGSDAAPFEAKIEEKNDSFTWKHRNLELRTYDRVVNLFHEGITNPNEIAKNLGITRQGVNKHIKRAKEEGEISS